MKQQHDSSEMKKGAIPMFINWCKKKIKAIVTIGSVGLVLAGIQTYKALFSPDIAEQINETIISTTEEYKVLEKTLVPDSVLSTNREVQLLKSYQDEFELYKLYLMCLDYSKINTKDDRAKLGIYWYRYRAILAYQEESTKMLKLTIRICTFEESIGNNNLVDLVNVNMMNNILEEQNIINNEMLMLKVHKGKKNNERLYKELDIVTGSERNLRLMRYQKELYKSVYILTNIRLKQIISKSTF